ncbi:serine protease [Streptomyces sp. NPDC127103]|uniref:S1 family peptidase n=1 Tax=Streptomyces sp. NPDC127103 TaxID=3347139 RepID=UPI00364DB9AD
MWFGAIDERHLYASLRLSVHLFMRDSGAPCSEKPSATGFVMRRGLFEKDPGILVTNRHVLDPDYNRVPKGKKLDKIAVSGFLQETHLGDIVGPAKPVQFKILDPVPVFADSEADIAVIDLRSAKIPGGCPQLTQLPSMQLATTDDFQSRIHVATEIITPGYPSIEQKVTKRPFLVSGTIASDPREAAEIGPKEYKDCVICHSFSWGGMSGSPVFCRLVAEPEDPKSWDEQEVHGPLTEVRLAGVNRGHLKIGGSNEGALSYFAKSTVLDQLLGKVGVKKYPDTWRM